MTGIYEPAPGCCEIDGITGRRLSRPVTVADFADGATVSRSEVTELRRAADKDEWLFAIKERIRKLGDLQKGII